jgi:predicted nucleotidyltransferase
VASRGAEDVPLIDFETALRVLVQAQVEFLVVGGVAARAHGSARLTNDLDILYRRSPENIERLAGALAPHAPYLRGAPPGLPFRLDAATIRRGLNFTLTTAFGDLDLLGEVTGGGGYEALIPRSKPIAAFGLEVPCLDLDCLIQVKRAAGRPKDLDAIAELEALLEERQRAEET